MALLFTFNPFIAPLNFCQILGGDNREICHIWLLATLKAWRKPHLQSTILIGQVSILAWGQLICVMSRPFLKVSGSGTMAVLSDFRSQAMLFHPFCVPTHLLFLSAYAEPISLDIARTEFINCLCNVC